MHTDTRKRHEINDDGLFLLVYLCAMVVVGGSSIPGHIKSSSYRKLFRAINIHRYCSAKARFITLIRKIFAARCVGGYEDKIAIHPTMK